MHRSISRQSGQECADDLSGIVASTTCDRVARVASAMLDAEGAYVTVRAGDRLEIVSAAGSAPAVPAGFDTPLEDSLCQFVISTRGPFSIREARTDTRLARFPAIAQHSIGAYLGVPLAAADGSVIGVLCVTDSDARTWSSDDEARMQDLALLASDALLPRATPVTRGEQHAELPSMSDSSWSEAAGPAASPTALTPREVDVLRLLAEGHQNREIAASLGVGLDTVKSHVSSVLRKLHVPTRSAAIVTAFRLGLLQEG